MIGERGWDLHICYCHGCRKRFDAVFDSFHDAADNGWRIFKNKNGDWRILCPVCNTPETASKVSEQRDETNEADLAREALEDL
jgi:hypothetical protein